MNSKSLKADIVRLLMKFVSCYTPLKDARFATLGGQGIEPRVWQEFGIPPSNGWLIERSRTRGTTLISDLRYRVHNQLRTFADILAGHGRENAYVDCCHLDLCGTLSNEAAADFEPVLPLVFRGTGRCLAVTVADSRRNLALEQWPDFHSRGKKLFGRTARAIYAELESMQELIPVNRDAPSFIKPFDPEKGARREFGLMVEIAELLFASGAHWVPESIVRYVYVSRYSGNPCRMRTYFFRFGKGRGAPSFTGFARAWAESPLFFSSGGDFQEVVKNLPRQDLPTMHMNTNSQSKLAAIAQALGGAEQAEYEELMAKSQRLDVLLSAINGAQPTAVTVLATVPAHHAPATVRHRVPRVRKKTWEDLPDHEQVEWQIHALELKSHSNGSWPKEWKDLLTTTFGYYSKKLGAQMRAALSRASGRFRPHFENRIRKVFGDRANAYLERYAKVLS
ncbi:MAG: hypothetical protein KGI79_01095 [Patescibacteria group bacterium]|nr:hypothetical protein [Patescibacteria group bacterium]MDE2116453.1 hypothetical protein [Patescibacteria group bacterium]